MQRGHQLDALVSVPHPAKPGNWGFALEKSLCSKSTECDDDLWLDEIKLFHQKGLAGGNLIRFRIAIVRRPALHYVGDIYILPAHFHAFDDNFGEQLPGSANERFPFQVLVPPRPLADKDKLGTGVAHPKDNFCPPLAELTAATIADLRTQLFEGLRSLHLGREEQIAGLSRYSSRSG